MKEKTGIALKREKIKEANFADLIVWLNEKETGYFTVPRTLPLILSLLDSKEISGKKSPSSVYLELFSRHRGEGIVDMVKESDHAFAAGYQGARAIRTWRERMQTLEKNHFIITKQVGNDLFGYVALVHPTIAIQKLFKEKRIPEIWMAAYLHRKLDTKEPTYEKLLEKRTAPAKFIPLGIVKNKSASRPQKAKNKV